MVESSNFRLEVPVSHIKRITPIRISDIDFTVARQIEQCPKTMMLRELVVNAVEAASKAQSSRRLVEIKGKRVLETGDARKLTIWNTGPGMTSEELDHICDLAASLRKDMALEGNFGMGAKVASLPSNPLGMRYRSCTNGAVSQVILGKRDGIYGKVWVPVDDGFEEVIDVTERVKAEEEYSLEEDWTEVVLFGTRAEQDTVADPYDGNPSSDRQWLTTALYHRIYRLPEDLQILLHEGTHPRDGRRPFKPITARTEAFGKYERVEVCNGTAIHYYYDPPYQGGSHNQSISGSITSSVSTAALVFKDEMYDVRKSRKWAADAPLFGIPFGARHISVHVELPSDFPVRHEPYRRFLQLTEGDQRQIEIEDFSDLVLHNRPEWLVEVINSFAPKSSASMGDLRKELQQLLNELRVKARSPRLTEEGEHAVEKGGARGASPNSGSGGKEGQKERSVKPDELMLNPSGSRRASISKNLEHAPEFILLRDDSDIEDKELVGKVARYFRETNQVFVNMRYAAFGEVEEHLANRYAAYEDPEVVRELVKQWSEKIVLGRVGYSVVYAQAKQLLRAWTSDDVKKALEPECLSVHADGWRDAVSSAYHSISRRLGMSQSKSKSEQNEELI